MIKSIDLIRKVDKLGRVVLPAEARTTIGIEEKDSLEVLVDKENEYIILKKSHNVCIRCQSSENLRQIKPCCYICGKCIEEIK